MTAPTLRLTVRAPEAEILCLPVGSVTAEDRTGRFGIRPGAAPMLAALVPGLVTARDLEGRELFVAVGVGLLISDREHVEIVVRHAVRCETLDEVASTLDSVAERASAGEATMRTTLKGLLDKVAVTLARGERR